MTHSITHRFSILSSIDYPAGAADAGFTYDPLDRATQMIDAVGTTIYSYHGSGNLLTEDGPWASDTVTYGYNNARLRNALTLQQPAKDKEYGGWVYQNDDGTTFSYTDPAEGESGSFTPERGEASPEGKGVASFHSHTPGFFGLNNGFHWGDRMMIDDSGVPGYLLNTDDNSMERYDNDPQKKRKGRETPLGKCPCK